MKMISPRQSLQSMAVGVGVNDVSSLRTAGVETWSAVAVVGLSVRCVLPVCELHAPLLAAQVAEEARRAYAADESEHHATYHRLAHEASLRGHQLPEYTHIEACEPALREELLKNILLGALSLVPKAGGCIARQVAFAILSQR